MATTTKTLTPTNQTITLPDMTERPNASVLVDGIGKDADAINALANQAKSFYTTTRKSLGSSQTVDFTISSALAYVAIVGDGNGAAVFSIIPFHNGAMGDISNLGGINVTASLNGTTLTVGVRQWCNVQAWSDSPIS